MWRQRVPGTGSATKDMPEKLCSAWLPACGQEGCWRPRCTMQGPSHSMRCQQSQHAVLPAGHSVALLSRCCVAVALGPGLVHCTTGVPACRFASLRVSVCIPPCVCELEHVFTLSLYMPKLPPILASRQTTTPDAAPPSPIQAAMCTHQCSPLSSEAEPCSSVPTQTLAVITSWDSRHLLVDGSQQHQCAQQQNNPWSFVQGPLIRRAGGPCTLMPSGPSWP